MAARRQVANKLRTPYWRVSKADKCKILDRVVATTGMGRSTARRKLTGPRLADPAERVDGRTLRPQRFSDDARALLEHVWALISTNLKVDVVEKFDSRSSHSSHPLTKHQILASSYAKRNDLPYGKIFRPPFVNVFDAMVRDLIKIREALNPNPSNIMIIKLSIL